MIVGMTFVRPLKGAVETVLGLVLAAVPLALWVARSPGVLLAVIGTGGVCAVLLIALSWLGDETPEEAPDSRADPARADVPDAFVEELHQLFPLVYHHSRREKPRFRRTMETLRRLMR
ncbi:MAG: hypothetical protein R3357_11010 [Burkholderiales bacterium]|nr:hypothetical protein [Burkholderiales bacterium]